MPNRMAFRNDQGLYGLVIEVSDAQEDAGSRVELESYTEARGDETWPTFYRVGGIARVPILLPPTFTEE